MLQKCEKFFCETYFIGLSEIYRTKHSLVRFLWIFFLSAGICLTLMFITFILQDYRNNPTVTKVYTQTKDKYDFPPIYVIVPFLDHLSSVWYNKSLSSEGVIFLQSLRRYFPPNHTMYKVGLSDVRQFAKRINVTTVSDLYLKVDDLDMMTALNCTNCNQTIFGKRKQLSDEYIMYDVPFYSANNREIYLDFQMYQVTIDVSNKSQQIFLGIGKPYQLLSLSNFIPLTIGQDYQVRITAKRLKRYNTFANSCAQETNLYTSCSDTCMKASLSQCMCQYDKYGMENIYKGDPCSTLLMNVEGTNCSLDDALKIILDCSKRCMPLCDEMIYDYSTVTVPNQFSNRIAVNFYLMFTDTGVMTYEETPSFTFVSAVSNVGSQLGLWLGLSVISFVQVGLLFLNHFLDRRSSKVVKVEPSTVKKSGKNKIQKVRY